MPPGYEGDLPDSGFHVAQSRTSRVLVLGRSFLIDNDPELTNPRLWLEAVDLPASNGRVHSIGRILFPIDV